MKKATHDWTEPAHLWKEDWAMLKAIKDLYEQGKMKEAMSLASSCDTIVREEIPPQVWLEMGGTLTRTGFEKLRQSKKKTPGKSKNR